MGMKVLLGLAAVLWCAFRLSAAAGTGTVTRDPTLRPVPRPELAPATEGMGLMTGEWTPLCVSLITPVELPPGDWAVRGLRVSLLYGRCNRLKGVDVGLLNDVRETLDGLQIGGVNTVGRLCGVQVGLFNGSVEMKGVQLGLVNYANAARGIQIGLVNVISESSPGFFPLIYGSF